MNGLVIKSPWIDRILQTPRTWVLRGSRTSTRGRVALIKARSGRIVGTARIIDCVGPLSPEELRAEAEKQQVPLETLMTTPAAKAFAWVLDEVKAFAEPIPYKHPTGSVVWVKLAPANVPDRYNELGDETPAPAVVTEVVASAPAAECQQPAPAPQVVVPAAAAPASVA